MYDEASDKTYVIYKMWGVNTEPALEALAEAFPDLGVSFEKAEEG